MDFYETQIQDYKVTQGDTLNLAFAFIDKNKNLIDDIVNQNWECKFTLEDPVTGDLITALVKTHNDVSPSGDGIYYNGDAYIVTGLGLTQNNQIVIILSNTETATLKEGIYKYYVKFEIDQAYHSEYTAVKGNLIVEKRET